jgi:two-component sensor histidine kinase
MAFMKYDLTAIGFFAASLLTALAGFAYVDRDRTLDRASERTYSVAQMMAAHAGAAIGEASARVSEIGPVVAAWDMADEAATRDIYDRLSAAVVSPSIGAIGIMDMQGQSRVNSWAYPSPPADISDRDFFALHLAGEDGPLLDGDLRPGPISARLRFTYSQAVRDSDGEQHAIVVVAIFADVFNALYSQVATWPAARASLYTMTGEQLAAMSGQSEVTATYVDALMALARTSTDGSAIIEDGTDRRLVSWSRTDGAVPVVAATSQEIEIALREWRQRLAVLFVLVLGLTAGFAVLLGAMRRARIAAENATFHRLAVTEVHHRVKNALQLTISMLNLRSRNTAEPDTRLLLDNLAGQLVAVAAIQDLLQHDTSLRKVDVCKLMDRLCLHLRNSGTGIQIRFKTAVKHCEMETTRASHAAIIVNELLTNAMKHARTDTTLTLDVVGDDVVLTVADDGGGLPEGFDQNEKDGFGLRVVGMIAERIGGNIVFSSPADGGTQAVLRVPLSET